MVVVGPRVRDLPLIVEGLLVDALGLHQAGGSPAGVDELLAQARALLAGEPVEVIEDRADGQG